MKTPRGPAALSALSIMDPGIEASALSAYLSPTDHLSASAPPLRSAHSSLSPGLPPSLALVRELSLFCAHPALYYVLCDEVRTLLT